MVAQKILILFVEVQVLMGLFVSKVEKSMDW